MRIGLGSAAIAATSLLAVSAHATTVYDVFTDYGASVFSYGSGVGAGLTPFSASYDPCFTSNFECMTSTGPDSVPAVGRVTTGGSAFFAGTVLVPTGLVWMHPDNGATPPTSVVFTAPTSGAYSIAGYFERLDTTNGSGTGVDYTVYDNGVSIASGNLPNSTYGETSAFADTLTLAAGDHISFSISNVSLAYSYDSTGLSATITAVPEPAAWAMMLVGFGGVGAAMRSRRKMAAASA
jgi:hypothetical protein